jgi:hypothetical protein
MARARAAAAIVAAPVLTPVGGRLWAVLRERKDLRDAAER